MGDLDYDGDLDIAAGSDTGFVYWYKNDGSGGFTQQPNIVNGIDPVYTVEVGDMNGDYYDDVVIGTSTGYVKYFNKLVKP